MRVITGRAKGKMLKSVPGVLTRPTSGNVKEAVFSGIQFDIQESVVLDLFAGTGQMGIEFLSRGAQKAVFVDHQNQAIQIIRDNLKQTGLENQAEVHKQDFEKYLENCRDKFDFIFLDPPYQSDALQTALKLISQFDILKSDGIIICESSSETDFQWISPTFQLIKDRIYGKKKVSTIGWMNNR